MTHGYREQTDGCCMGRGLIKGLNEKAKGWLGSTN